MRTKLDEQFSREDIIDIMFPDEDARQEYEEDGYEYPDD